MLVKLKDSFVRPSIALAQRMNVVVPCTGNIAWQCLSCNARRGCEGVLVAREVYQRSKINKHSTRVKKLSMLLCGYSG